MLETEVEEQWIQGQPELNSDNLSEGEDKASKTRAILTKHLTYVMSLREKI